MPKEKKSMKLRDQKPEKDPRGGGGHGAKNHQLNSAGTEGTSKNQKHHHGGHSHF